jgi:hypothetical protein
MKIGSQKETKQQMTSIDGVCTNPVDRPMNYKMIALRQTEDNVYLPKCSAKPRNGAETEQSM